MSENNESDNVTDINGLSEDDHRLIYEKIREMTDKRVHKIIDVFSETTLSLSHLDAQPTTDLLLFADLNTLAALFSMVLQSFKLEGKKRKEIADNFIKLLMMHIEEGEKS